MKIKTDFITNSSSTCFIVMKKGDFTLESFLKASGIDKTSDFTPIFKSLFFSLANNLTPLEEGIYAHRWHKPGTTPEQFISSVFSKDTWERILKAREDGYEIFIGDLVSDNNAIESFFCTSSFIIESDDLVIDATCDAW